MRWLEEDPLGDGLNWYVYCEGDPVNFVDPLGLCKEKSFWDKAWDVTKNISNKALDFADRNKQQIVDIAKGAIEIGLGKAIQGLGTLGGGVITVGSGGTLVVAGGALAVGSIALGEALAIHGSIIIGKASAEIVNKERQYASTNSGGSGKGTQNQKVKEAVEKGKQMHKKYDYGPGVKKEKTLPSGKRMDGYNKETKTVHELKPNNPNAISKGLKQLDQYVEEANKVNGPGHTGKLHTY
jgi:hypothetical protein